MWLLPVSSATNLTWSSQGMVADLSFPSYSWMDPSAAWANGCTEIFAEWLSKAFKNLEAVSLLLWFDEAWYMYEYLLQSDCWWWLCWNLLSWKPYLCCSSLLKHLEILLFGTGNMLGVLHGLTDLPLPVLVLNLSGISWLYWHGPLADHCCMTWVNLQFQPVCDLLHINMQWWDWKIWSWSLCWLGFLLHVHFCQHLEYLSPVWDLWNF